MRSPSPHLALLTALLAASLAGCAPREPEGVVLVVVDTLRADRLSGFGYERPTSERLDLWAVEGRVFERTLSSSPWTLPTIATVFTGQLPSTHLAGWKEPDSDNRMPLGSDLPTLAERLSENGFGTAAFFTNTFVVKEFGLDRGFDVYEHVGGRPGQEVVAAAMDWLREVDGPYFLLIHIIEPHLPYYAPEPIRGRFSGGDLGQGPIRGPGRVRHRLKGMSQENKDYIAGRYDEEIVATDVVLDGLRQDLEESGHARRGLVVLMSDHGEELFEHGGFEHGHSVFQEVLHVPLVFWGPGVVPGRDGTAVSTLDLPSTLLDALGVDSAGFSPERSLWPHLSAGESVPRRAFVVEGTLYGPELKSLVDWPMKLIVDWGSRRARLFDLEADPGERHDLSSERPEVVERMRAALEQRIQQAAARAGERAAPVELTPELERELRALGYLED